MEWNVASTNHINNKHRSRSHPTKISQIKTQTLFQALVFNKIRGTIWFLMQCFTWAMKVSLEKNNRVRGLRSARLARFIKKKKVVVTMVFVSCAWRWVESMWMKRESKEKETHVNTWLLCLAPFIYYASYYSVGLITLY